MWPHWVKRKNKRGMVIPRHIWKSISRVLLTVFRFAWRAVGVCNYIVLGKV